MDTNDRNRELERVDERMVCVVEMHWPHGNEREAEECCWSERRTLERLAYALGNPKAISRGRDTHRKHRLRSLHVPSAGAMARAAASSGSFRSIALSMTWIDVISILDYMILVQIDA